MKLVYSCTYYFPLIMATGYDMFTDDPKDEENMDPRDPLKSASNDDVPFTVRSNAFLDNSNIPLQYCRKEIGGENLSIPVLWENEPEGIKSVFLYIIDKHPVANNWIHWAIKNIPPGVLEIMEGASNTDKMPDGAVELINSYNETGYGGPQPPAGSGDHPYEIHVYALNTDNVDIDDSPDIEQIDEVLQPLVIARSHYTGYVGR